jgi:hypothetical protein
MLASNRERREVRTSIAKSLVAAERGEYGDKDMFIHVTILVQGCKSLLFLL